MIEVAPSLRKRSRRQLPKENRDRIIERDEHKCFYCESTERLTVDHVIPINHGGSDCAANLITSCHSCNSKKNGRTRLLPLFERHVLDVIEKRNLDFGIDNNFDMSTINGVAVYREREPRRGKYEKKIPRKIKRMKKRIISMAHSGIDLFLIKAIDKKDMDRIRVSCKRAGRLYLGIPIGAGDERMVLVNGRIKGAKKTTPDDINMLIEIIGNQDSSRFSGKLA